MTELRARQKNNKGLLDKENFKQQEKEKGRWLRNLSMKKAIHIEESLLSSSFIWEWRKNFVLDAPICLKDILNKKA